MNWFNRTLKTLGSLSPTCKEAVRLQSDAMDRTLPPVERLGLRIHLALCKWCRRYGGQIAFLRETARAHPTDGPLSAPHRLPPGAKERIQQKLRSGDG